MLIVPAARAQGKADSAQVPLLQKVFVSRREERCAGPLLHADPLPLTNPALGVVSLQRANPLAVCEPARGAWKRSVHPVS